MTCKVQKTWVTLMAVLRVIKCIIWADQVPNFFLTWSQTIVLRRSIVRVILNMVRAWVNVRENLSSYKSSYTFNNMMHRPGVEARIQFCLVSRTDICEKTLHRRCAVVRQALVCMCVQVFYDRCLFACACISNCF